MGCCLVKEEKTQGEFQTAYADYFAGERNVELGMTPNIFRNAPEVSVPDTPETNKAAIVLQTILVRNVDPITICPIRKPFFLSRNGAMIRWDPETLFEYICQTGDLSDPVCKQRYETHELMRIQRVVGKKLPFDLDRKFCKNNDADMMIDFLVDEVITAFSLSVQSESEMGMMDAIYDLSRIVQSSTRRDSVVTRLREAGIRTSFLAPLILLATNDEIQGST